MALTKEKKNQVIDEISQLLGDSKMTVFATYQGTSVKSLQQLRKDAKAKGTAVKVFKNRLVMKALANNEIFKDSDIAGLKGQLIYAFNSEDEVAPAQALAEFAKAQPSIVFAGAFSADGAVLTADEVKSLAELPNKSELIAQVIATLQSPLNDVMGGLSGNLHALLDGVEAKAQA